MWRKYHRIISVIIALPFTVTLLTGIVLQLRQQFDVIQPKPVKMERIEGQAILSLEEMLKASGQPEQVEQIVWRPKKFHLSMRMQDGRELQVHPQTGEVLKSAYRMTNILIDLHQGSFFTTWAQYGIFFPSALGVLFLTLSGLMIYPWRKKRVS